MSLKRPVSPAKQQSLMEPELKKIKKDEEKEEEEEGEICAICQENINDGRPLKYCDSQSHIPTGENPRAHPHVFHQECIDHWLRLNDNNNNSCPLCGADVLCLDADKYRAEYPEGGEAAEIPIYNPNPDNYNPDDIESDSEEMDMEPTDQEGNDINVNVWNEQHPRGPWWRIISCETPVQNCPDDGNDLHMGKNFQWFLSHEPQAVEITDGAQASGWESIDGDKICPVCADADIRDYCEHCGEGYFFPEQNLTHVDDELLCDECMERAGINPETGETASGNIHEVSSMATARVGGRKKTPHKKTRKAKRKNKKLLKLSKTRFKSPTTLSIFPEKSPQLQGEEPSILNAFTAKNVQTSGKNGQSWNGVENGKLAYKRSARGAPVGNFPKIIYGPRVERLTQENYKRLSKDTHIFYDRSSVVFRGPFIYQKILRGPNLLLTTKDVNYMNKVYKFVIPVSKLKTEPLYFVVKGKSHKQKTLKRKRKKNKKHTLRRVRRRHKSKTKK